MESDSGTSWVIDTSESPNVSLEFDWSTATTKQKAMLFPVCNRLRLKLGASWEAFFKKAGLTNIGQQYEQNLRRGKISSRNARLLFTYLQTEHGSEAVRLVGELRKPPSRTKSEPSGYQELLFRKLNYSQDGARYADENVPLDDDPDPPKTPRKRKARKKA